MISLINGIKLDQGFYDKTCVTHNFYCKDSIPYTFVISFNNPFENIPQVFITFQHIGVFVKTDFRIEIKDITTQDFSLHIVCLTSLANCLRINWYAIDDQRFQIVNVFHTINLTQMTYQHKNKNVNTEIALINLISHNYDEIYFNLKIDEITTDTVTVSLTKVPQDFQKQIQVGFQIILGPKEAFQNFLFIDSTNDYEIQITERLNSWFITLFTGMGYPYTDATSIFKYSLKTFQTDFTPCSHSHGFLNYSISTVFYSLNLQKLSVIQNSQVVSTTQISIHFLPNNQILDTNGDFYLTLDKDLTEIVIEIHIVCPQGKQIESTFQRCFNCSTQKLYNQIYQCTNTLKEVFYKVQYSKQAPAYSELVINLKQNSYFMEQLWSFLFYIQKLFQISILYNQKLEEAQIFSINLKER